MTDGNNKEFIEVLKRIERQLGDIKFDLANFKCQYTMKRFFGLQTEIIRNAMPNSASGTISTGRSSGGWWY